MSLFDNIYQNELFGRRDARRNSNSTPMIQTGGNYFFNIAGQNEIVKAWIPKVTSALKSSAATLVDGKTKSFVMRGEQKERKLADSIAAKTKEEYGAIERVSFTFERHGVFVHKGVSRGHPITSPREKIEWFNPVIERYVPELANKLAELNADAAVDATKMKIR